MKKRQRGNKSDQYNLLEPRKMLAVTVSLDADSGVLSILGDNDANMVRVENLTEDTVDVTVEDSVVESFEVSVVTSIDFRGLGGADEFANSTDIPTTARGGGGDDVIVTGRANDLIYGGNGNDTLTGKQGQDTIYGGDGDDEIRGNKDDDSLYGGAGNDSIVGGQGTNLILGGDGDDNIEGAGPPADPGANVFSNNEIYGGDGNDVIFGGDQEDMIWGGNGADEIHGLAGNDIIIGGLGHDRLFGGDGNDELSGNDGNDGLFGQNGRDTLFGGAGFDRLIGHLGADEIFGGTENDDIYGDLFMADSDMYGDSDIINGGSGSDTIFGRGGQDTISGGSGNDVIDAGYGPDLVYAGAGDDFVRGGEGVDYIWGFNGNDDLVGGGSFDRIYGGNGDDLIFGGEGNDSLYGMNGNDMLFGGPGRDGLVSGPGFDELSGEGDSDRFLTRFNSTIIDFENDDVEIKFRSQPGHGKWTNQQMHLVDFGLLQLHASTGNNEFLTDPFTDQPIVMMKADSLPGSHRIGTNSFDGNVRTYTIADFQSDEWLRDDVSYDIIREIAHVWASDEAIAAKVPQRPSHFTEFQAISGWTTDPENPEDYTLSDDGTEYYLSDSVFADDPLATYNSAEDFASIWANRFRPRNDDVFVPLEKDVSVRQLISALQ